MSHTSLTYHLIFGTYRRMNVINIDHERELYKFMYDFSMKRGVKVWRIGGMPDHVHFLCDIPPKLSVSDFVKLLKGESSKFMRVNKNFPLWNGWAEGYGGFSVDASLLEVRIRYIMNQKQHHGRVSFVDEYKDMLRSVGFPEDTPILGDEMNNNQRLSDA